MKAVKKKTKSWGSDQDREVIRLHGTGYTPESISQSMKWRLPLVMDAHRRLGLVPYEEPQEPERMNGKRLPVDAVCNPVKFARERLGQRFEDKGTHWLLDGTPCDLDRLMTEINRKVKAEGYAGHVGKNPAWHGK